MLRERLTLSGDRVNIDDVEIKGFSRSIAELEWLLLILVLLYFVSPGAIIDDRPGVIVSMLVYAAWVIAFRYSNFYRKETRFKLALETWLMILFISWILWNSGGVESPLLNLYLLVIITSSLTLGKVVTLLEFVLITSIYVLMSNAELAGGELSVQPLSELMARFAPFLLVAYLTTMLSADLQYSRQMFRELAEKDDMTGLLNKRSFRLELEREFKSAVRYDRQFSIMMIDADNLKEVNDVYGHEAGDKMILMIASTIRECVRESDVIARYGGDEFVVLMTDTSDRQASELGVRIKTSITNTSFNHLGKEVRSSVSIGIACYPEDGADQNEILELADQALYKSKNEGRNKVSMFACSADEEPLEPVDEIPRRALS
jgi:diguanylate cyclase (GGDEF)-like protein